MMGNNKMYKCNIGYNIVLYIIIIKVNLIYICVRHVKMKYITSFMKNSEIIIKQEFFIKC